MGAPYHRRLDARRSDDGRLARCATASTAEGKTGSPLIDAIAVGLRHGCFTRESDGGSQPARSIQIIAHSPCRRIPRSRSSRSS